jgi:hypothetical protein
MRISSTQMKVWGSYNTSYPKAYSSALIWDFTSTATIYKTFKNEYIILKISKISKSL